MVVVRKELRWTVHPLSTPEVVRRCPRCDRPRPFASSGRFRLNAQKRRLDAWLVYKCTVCDATWNARLKRRESADAMDVVPVEENDAAAAEAAAFLIADERAVPYVVERDPSDAPVPPVTIRILLAAPLEVRLDRLLAGELGISRAQVLSWHDSGRLRTPGGALRRPVRNGQLVQLFSIDA